MKYCDDNGFCTPPRSACIMCPYRCDREWLEMKENSPEEFAEAVEFDEYVRNAQEFKNYVSRHGIPLAKVDFRTYREKQDQELIDSECEGYCGV